jgi:hypothetical protein
VITTPLKADEWAEALEGHPDRRFRDYILQGISQGFRIGFDHQTGSAPRSCRRNMRSAYEHPEVVSEYLAQECRTARVLGPFPSSPLPQLQVSSFGVIPKRHQPGKWCLILDLSSSEGHSVNDGIDQTVCSLQFISVDTIAGAVFRAGRGALVAKSDVQHAYRQVPVHPDDRPLLGMRWQGHTYIDATLPFGLRSAPLIFSAVADALEWVVRSRGVRSICHYIDDFIIVGAPRSDECARGLQIFLSTSEALGMRISVDKTEGPAVCLTILGIQVDTLAMTLSLPAEKLQRIGSLLQEWHGRSAGTRRDLESLVGTLQHAAYVVRPGRLFLRRIYDLLAGTSHFKPHYFVRLNAECRADIEWWVTFHRSWNGVAIIRSPDSRPPDVVLCTDASGSWGGGAFWKTRWFQVPWCGLSIAGQSIAAKELFPIVLASLLWGRTWHGLKVLCRCDNGAVVEVVNRQSARDPLLCHLLRCLFYASARFDFEISAQHTPGASNVAADALSRNNLRLFFVQVPHAASQPTVIPPELPQHLSQARPAWTSRDWIDWFRAFCSTL